MLRSLFVSLIAVLIALEPQTASAEPSQQQKALAHRYVEALQLQQTSEASMQAAMPALIASMPGTNAEKAEMAEDTRDIVTHMRTKLYALYEPAVAETFTAEELEGIVAFYESPTGQALVAKQPLVSAKLAPAMKTMIPDLMSELLAKQCARHKDSLLCGPPKKISDQPS